MKITIPQELTDAINDNKLVIFVGAGLSINHGLPSWKKIIDNLLINKKEYIPKAEDYLNALRANILSPLEVLEKIKEDKKYILESFELDLSIENTESNLHKSLDKISKKFITTNFDKLIESNSTIKNIITQDSIYNLTKIDKDKEFIIKIHGDIDRIDACVIFEDQYKDLYSDDKLAPFQIKKIISTYSCLFLGFSFTDPFVTNLFDYVESLVDGFGPKHFVVHTGENTYKKIISINIKDYNELEPFIVNLGKESNKKEENIITSVTNETANEKDIIIELDGSDLAPNVTDWIGRDKELAILNSNTFKVYFITGIGGEGKSALASHYINNETCYDIIDWRDFKEEEHKFKYKIFSMIKKVYPSLSNNELVGLTDEQLITFFFKKLSSQKGVFVLDNIDSYIDLENFEPVDGIGKLFNAALTYDHNSKFIFTCRPFIRYAGVEFYQLSLSGLTVENTIDYFLSGDIQVKKDLLISYAKRAHSLTNGHALWLSLIVAQSRRGEKALKNFLHHIESGENIDKDDSSIMSKKVLNSIWNLLLDRDKLVLRSLAESIVAETSEEYAIILRPSLNHNKFQKALKALKNLNLIIEKRGTNHIELHPLVKEFIRTNYPSSERSEYISMFIQYYDRFVVILKNKLSYKLSYEEFSNFTNKAELSINASNHQEAINTLSEVISSMVSAGYSEEYLRVGKLLFSSISWSKKNIDTFTNFDELLRKTIQSFIEYGDSEYAYSLIEKYESIIEHKGENYIQLCSTKSYSYWFNKDYKKAIDIAEEALYLLDRAGQADKFSVKHNLALAYRDNEELEDIDKALDIFLLSNELSTIVSIDFIEEEDNGSMYGNVGKCLFLKGQLNDSLVCYYKSFYSIYTYSRGQRLLNLGYAAFWIAELLLKTDKIEESYYFLKYAKNSWEKSSPLLINQNIVIFDMLKENSTSRSIVSQEFWRIEKYCFETIEKHLNIQFKS